MVTLFQSDLNDIFDILHFPRNQPATINRGYYCFQCIGSGSANKCNSAFPVLRKHLEAFLLVNLGCKVYAKSYYIMSKLIERNGSLHRFFL